MDEELKAMLAAMMARLDKLEAGEVGEKKPGTDAETGTTEAVVDPNAAKAAAGATDEDVTKPAEMAKDEDKPAEAASAMDALTNEVKALKAQLGAVVVMDEAAVVKTLARKTDLASRLAVHIGTFDHAGLTFDQVVAYGVEKLGLKDVPKGSEAVALDAALQIAKAPTPFTIATDSAKTGLGSSIAAYVAGA